MVSQLRMWRSNTNNLEEIEGLSKKHKNYTQVKVDAVCIYACNPTDQKKIIEDVQLAEEDILILELPKAKD